MPSPLKIYARRFDATASHVPFLAPWWGVPTEDPASLNCGQFAAWGARQPAGYTLTDTPSDADFHLLSIPWKRTRTDPVARKFADEAIAAARLADRQIGLFFDSDHDELIAWPAHAVVFRFSLYRDTRRSNEFAIPTFSQDLARGEPIAVREKSPVPSVSFCGYAPPLAGHFSAHTVQEALRYAAYRVGALTRRRRWIAHAPRVQAVRALRRARGVDAHFLVRAQFAFNRWGVLQPGGTPATAARQRAEFLANLAGADYALCTRGLANCSIRFYEALSLGRLPLFVDTQCVLPYDWMVDWRQAGCWVEENDLPRIGARLRAHHAAVTPADFIAQQHLGRALFERWIRPEGFFTELHRHFSAHSNPR